jgi:hypothetical protein
MLYEKWILMFVMVLSVQVSYKIKAVRFFTDEQSARHMTHITILLYCILEVPGFGIAYVACLEAFFVL